MDYHLCARDPAAVARVLRDLQPTLSRFVVRQCINTNISYSQVDLVKLYLGAVGAKTPADLQRPK